ncbi:MAG: hypothetical protein NTY53_22725 [Kiritimatiellaeota bacterium]|nr:hypothetical protein [Kiritimatiellota bacterium]
MKTNFFLPIGLLLCLCSAAQAEVKLSRVFGHHMVLQRDVTIPVWGSADPGEAITVTLGGDRATTTANAAGQWSVRLPKRGASAEPLDLTVAGKNTLSESSTAPAAARALRPG